MERFLLMLITSNFYELNPTIQKAIYKEFYQLIYLNILYIVKDHSTTEDIIQESFLIAIRNSPQFENEIKLNAWLKVIAKNMAYNYLRKNKKRNEFNIEAILLYETKQFCSEISVCIENEVESKIMKETIEQIISQIRPEYRVLIELRWKHELSYKEIAEKLNTSEDIVRQKLYRARVTIKRRFSKLWK